MIPKFRAWDKEHDEMLYPDDVDKIYFEITVDGIVTYDMRYILPYDDIPPYLDTVIMQSTGLTDVNGKEIFEGDIVKYWENIGYIEFYQGSWVINWNDGSLFDLYDNDNNLEVLGNIHEHPELLENI
ncbi:YopX protein [Macrococcoides caseolyticum]|uniref:YopX family protein n=1 Tax=Macrococcoides caseolyticum TaxID=69966 RepID=UPI000A294331|nr:YopX family protein [Macrococcus caseolyticus]ARQ04715.1 YopX protein [Macrococcus caseolyticus]